MDRDSEYKNNTKKRPVIELKGIKKYFGGVKALDGVDFKLFKGEIIALIGDNGAGKSTLIKIITGVHNPTEGEIYIEGKKIGFLNPKLSRSYGIETIYQDLALFNILDIPTNLFAGREIRKGLFFLNLRKMDELSKEALDKTGITLGSTMRQKVAELSGGQKHAVAISRSVYISGSPKIILMDEPTAGLGVKESGKLLDIVKSLKKQEISVILITHDLTHAFEVADRFVVLRSGKKVGERDVAKTRSVELVEMMVGVAK